jgi:hypothetical protein
MKRGEIGEHFAPLKSTDGTAREVRSIAKA